VVFDLFNYAGVLDVEDAEYSGLEAAGEEEPFRVGSKTQAVVVSGVAEFVGLLKFFRIP
jgi:hypothetical protein